jgi:hypothetical protein
MGSTDGSYYGAVILWLLARLSLGKHFQLYNSTEFFKQQTADHAALSKSSLFYC